MVTNNATTETKRPQLGALVLKCPTLMPEKDRQHCFFNDASGNCEHCLFPLYREKIEADRQEWIREAREHYYAARGGVR